MLRHVFTSASVRCLARFVLVYALLAIGCTARTHEAPPLRFSAPQGAELNEFFRQGPAAAHLVLTPGLAPRVVVAFPAGNSGAAIWFEARSALSWQPSVTVQAKHRAGSDRRMWHGVSAEVAATGGPSGFDRRF